MNDDWNRRYDAALKEMSLAQEEYKIADSAKARANARLNNAERVLNTVWNERMREIEGTASEPQ